MKKSISKIGVKYYVKVEFRCGEEVGFTLF